MSVYKRILFLGLLLRLCTAFAQDNVNVVQNQNFVDEKANFQAIDKYVQTLNNPGDTPEQAAVVICEKSITSYEKARALFYWLATFINYDYSYSIHEGQKTFAKRKGVCEGYADLYCIMSQAVGLQSYKISGHCRNSRTGGAKNLFTSAHGHAWNCTLCGNRMILLDACWGNRDNNSTKVEEYWFDPSPAVLIFTHYPDSPEFQFLEPVISKSIFNNMSFITPEYYTDFTEASNLLNKFINSKSDSSYVFPFASTNFTLKRGTDFIYFPSENGRGFLVRNTEISLNEWSSFEYDTRKITYKSIGTTVYDFENTEEFYLRTGDDSFPFFNYPLDSVNVKRAAEYCNWRSEKEHLPKCYTFTDDGNIVCNYDVTGYRLPTVDEWKMMCGEEVDSESFEKEAWFKKNNTGILCRPGMKLCNSLGLYDVYGNVGELCGDSQNGYASYGGNYKSTEEECKSSQGIGPDSKGNFALTGFRLVRSEPVDASALELIAEHYFFGVEKNSSIEKSYKMEFPEDYSKAFFWYNKAYEAGSMDACDSLGICYLYGRGVDVDNDKAISYLLISGESGNSYACYNLYKLYADGTNPKHDPALAAEWLLKAGIAGKTESYIILANRYKTGDEYFAKSDAESMKWLELAAQSGDVDAMIEAAGDFEKGTGTTIDLVKALRYYLLAADKGSVLACNCCASMYEEGRGTDKNFYRAETYYKKAIDKGNDWAKYRLGCMYINASGSKFDAIEAERLIKEAIDGGLNQILVDSTLLPRVIEHNKFVNSFGKYKEQYLNQIPGDCNVLDYTDLVAQIATSAKKLNGMTMSNPLMFTCLSQKDLLEKIVKPMEALTSETEDYSYTKTALVILPPGEPDLKKVPGCFFSRDYFAFKDVTINGEKYKVDESVYDYYDGFIFIQLGTYENGSSFDKAVSQLNYKLPAGALLDVYCFANNSIMTKVGQNKNSSASFSKLLSTLIDGGRTPRIVGLENSSSYLQTLINKIMANSYIDKIKIFDIPTTIEAHIGLGFRKGKLCVFFKTDSVSEKKTIVFSLIEDGLSDTNKTKATDFSLSRNQITAIFDDAKKKKTKGSVVKTSGVVMTYQVVKNR